jgi:hypothetical protein
MRMDATIGVAYYPVMASMPQWELPHTKVQQAQRTVGLLHKDFHYSVKNREQIFSDIPNGCFDIPLLSKTAMMLYIPFNFWLQNYCLLSYPSLCKM